MSRRPVAHQPRPLESLVPNSELLEMRGERVWVKERRDTPLTEFGTPDMTALVGAVLGTLAIDKSVAWSGLYDEHHLAWPKRHYIEVNRERGPVEVSRAYRESSMLKYRIPRQLHEYLHAAFEPPKLPDGDVMHQWTKETTAISRLRDASTQLAYYRMLDEVIRKVDPRLGILPDLEELASLDLATAKQKLGAIAAQKTLPRNIQRWHDRQLGQSLEEAA